MTKAEYLDAIYQKNILLKNMETVNATAQAALQAKRAEIATIDTQRKADIDAIRAQIKALNLPTGDY